MFKPLSAPSLVLDAQNFRLFTDWGVEERATEIENRLITYIVNDPDSWLSRSILAMLETG